MSEAAESRKPRKQRSPSYPSLDLETAVQRARELYATEGRHWAPIPSVLDAWGYKAKSSGGFLAVAALKRYGLLEDRGALQTREARLTDLAMAIILDEREDSSERQERLRHAALTPTIHREIWDKYEGSLPSPSTLRYHLTMEREFTTAGADDFMAQFRRTVEFAKLTAGSATLSGDHADKNGNGDTETLLQEPPLLTDPGSTSTVVETLAVGGRTARTIQITYSPDEWAILQGKFPMSEEDWDSMIAVLQAMKRGLVSRSPKH